MDEETFWEIVDEARADAYDDDEAFLRGLESSLMELPPNAIESFRDRLDDMARKAFRWDLWAAAYIINGSASEDGFEYFRGWLVSRGRSVYEGALRDPETLTDLVPLDSEWFAEFEEFLYLPVYTLEQKTGKAVPLADPLETLEILVEPEGEPWNKETVDTLFPKLSQRAKKKFQS